MAEYNFRQVTRAGPAFAAPHSARHSDRAVDTFRAHSGDPGQGHGTGYGAARVAEVRPDIPGTDENGHIAQSMILS